MNKFFTIFLLFSSIISFSQATETFDLEVLNVCMIDSISETEQVQFQRIYWVNRDTFSDKTFDLDNGYTPLGSVKSCEPNFLSDPICYAEKIQRCDFLINGSGNLHTAYEDRDGNIMFTPSSGPNWDTNTTAGMNAFIADLSSWLMTQGEQFDSIKIQPFGGLFIRVYNTTADIWQYELTPQGVNDASTSRIESSCYFTGEVSDTTVQIYYTSTGLVLDYCLVPIVFDDTNYEKVYCEYPDEELIKQCWVIPDTILLCDYSYQVNIGATDTIEDFVFNDLNAVQQSLLGDEGFNFPYDANNNLSGFVSDLNSWLASTYSGSVAWDGNTNLAIISFEGSSISPVTIETNNGQYVLSTQENCESWANGYDIFEVYFSRGRLHQIWNKGSEVSSLPMNAVWIDCGNYSNNQNNDCKTEIIAVEQKYDLTSRGGDIGEIYTLFSKYNDPHPDLASYPASFTFIGNVTGGNHPALGFGINGWRVYATCATQLPNDDSNGHSWLSGPPDDFTGVTFTRINDDPVCGAGETQCIEIQEIKEKDCNGKETYRFVIESEFSDSLIAYNVQGEISNNCPVDSDCETNVSQVMQCAVAATSEASINDFINTIVTLDCNNIIIGSSSYNLSTGGNEITDIPETGVCADAELKTVCKIDSLGNEFEVRQVVNTVTGATILELFFDPNNLQYTPIGLPSSWSNCIEASNSTICKSACVEGVKVEILIGVDNEGNYTWLKNIATSQYVDEDDIDFAASCPELSCETSKNTLCADGNYPDNGISDGDAILVTIQDCNDGSSQITAASFLSNPTVSILPLPNNISFQNCTFTTVVVGCIVDEDNVSWDVISVNGTNTIYQNLSDGTYGTPNGNTTECPVVNHVIDAIEGRYCIEVAGDTLQAFLFLNNDKTICAKPIGSNTNYQQGDYILVDCCSNTTVTETLHFNGFNANRPTNTPNTGWNNELTSTSTGINGDFNLCFTPTHNGGNVPNMIGLNSDPNTNASYTSIDCALYLYFSNGLYRIYEYRNGGGQGLLNSSNWSGQEICMERIGGDLRYYLNGIQIGGVCPIGTGTVFLDDSHYFANGFWGTGQMSYSDFVLRQQIGSDDGLSTVEDCKNKSIVRVDNEPICADGEDAFRVSKYDYFGNRVDLFFEKPDGTVFTPSTFNDCGGGGSINVTNNDVGVDFAYGGFNANGTLRDTFNVVSIVSAGVGIYNVTMGQPHPEGINYNVVFGVQEGVLVDVPKPSVVEGSITPISFQVRTTEDDNGGTADIPTNNTWSFRVPAKISVVTSVTN